MKPLLAILFVLAGISMLSAQQTPAQTSHCASPKDDAALRAIAETWRQGYNSADPDKVAALYAPDATYFTQHFAAGIVQGRTAIRAYVKHGTDAGYTVESIRVLKTECSGDMAYSLTRYESMNAGVKAFGHNIVVMRKIKGRWLIVAHSSAVPEPTAIQKLDIR